MENIKVNYEVEDSKASAKIDGNSALEVRENIFKIVVTAEDNTTREYIINIEKGNNIVLPIALISVALASIITAVIRIIKKRRR